jgi:hypothetical protein
MMVMAVIDLVIDAIRIVVLAWYYVKSTLLG